MDIKYFCELNGLMLIQIHEKTCFEDMKENRKPMQKCRRGKMANMCQTRVKPFMESCHVGHTANRKKKQDCCWKVLHFSCVRALSKPLIATISYDTF